MSGDDAALRQIVAEFRALGAADRRAILSRLRFDERLRFEAALHPGTATNDVSPALAALVQDEGALTETARAALAAALAAAPAGGTVATPPSHRPTLIDRLWRR